MLKSRVTVLVGLSFAGALAACGGGGNGSAGCPAAGAARASEACVRAELGIPPDADRVLVLSQSSHLDWDWLKTFEDYYVGQVEGVFTKAVALMEQSHSVAEQSY